MQRNTTSSLTEHHKEGLKDCDVRGRQRLILLFLLFFLLNSSSIPSPPTSTDLPLDLEINVMWAVEVCDGKERAILTLWGMRREREREREREKEREKER